MPEGNNRHTISAHPDVPYHAHICNGFLPYHGLGSLLEDKYTRKSNHPYHFSNIFQVLIHVYRMESVVCLLPGANIYDQ